MRRLSLTVIAVGALLLLAAPVALASRPASGRWTGIDKNGTKLTFTVSHGRMLRFHDPKVGCTSYTGYQVETVYIPRATIHSSGRFDEKHHVTRHATIELKGRFHGSRSASGVIHEISPCNTGDESWVARPGTRPPVIHHRSAAHGSCTAASCRASNGMLIHTTVDRSLVSPNDPSNAFNTDPKLAGGGVEVTVRGVDESASGVVDFAPFANFQLRTGSGQVVGNEDPGTAKAVGAGGRSYDCSDRSANLTRGASFTGDVCYPVPASARHGLTLYYMPDGFDILARIPLG